MNQARESSREAADASPSSPSIVIIGAGMAGILTAIRLLEAGYRRITIFEKSDSLGGVWRDNVYPGIRCDVPARMFCYSFAPNPDYSHRFATGREIWEYLRATAERFEVSQLIRFSKSVTDARLEDSRWRLTTADGETAHADVVICCTGILHNPKFPELEGRDRFAGTDFHTARWDRDCSLAGKRVGIIGTGSTAAQVIPAVAREAAELVVFQRSPQWIFPMPNRRYRDWEKRVLGRFPRLAKTFHYLFGKAFQWSFSQAMIGSKPHVAWVRWQCLRHLRRKVKDPVMRERLTPTDRVGCKRLIHAKGFYEALQRPNVTVESGNLRRITPQGVETDQGQTHALDVLIYATGFHAHRFMRPMNVTGEAGLTLADAWRDGTTSHRSVAIPGFPNFFMTLGPYSPIGNYSAIAVAEVQVEYLLRLIDQIRAGNCDLIAPKTSACEAFMRQADAGIKQTAWYSGCQSWYLDQSGRTAMWPWSFQRFRQSLHRPQLSEFVMTRRPATDSNNNNNTPTNPKKRDSHLQPTTRNDTELLPN